MSYSTSPGSTPGPGPGGTYPSRYSPSPPRFDDDDSSSVADQAVFVIVSILAGLVVGVVAAVAWAQLADPPSATLTRQGVFLGGETDYNQQVTVTLWFLLVGGVLGFVSGLFVGWRGRRHGIATVLAVLLLCAAASSLSAWLGVNVLGPDLSAQAEAAAVGDLVRSELSITSDVAYLGWPIGGLVGALLGIGSWPGYDKRSRLSPPSSTVVPHPSSIRGQ